MDLPDNASRILSHFRHARSVCERRSRPQRISDDPAGLVQAELSDRLVGRRAGGDARGGRRRLAVRDHHLLRQRVRSAPPRPSSSWRCCAWCWSSRRARSRTQLTSARVSAVADVMFRWLLLLAVLLGDRLRHQIASMPTRAAYFLTWAVVTPVALIVVDAGHAGAHASLPDERVRQAQRHLRRLQQQQPGTRAASEEQPGHAPGGVRILRRSQHRPARHGSRRQAHRTA